MKEKRKTIVNKVIERKLSKLFFSIFSIIQFCNCSKFFSIFQSFNFTLIVSIFVIFQSCTEHIKEEDHVRTTDTLSSEIVYYCPMDTQVVRNKPGTCPICKMDLEPKPRAHGHGSMNNEGWVYTPANAFVLSSIQSIKPVLKSVPIKIKVSGYIGYDERRINSVSAKIGGRIENLYVKYNFQPIKKGQALFEIFSHDLQTAQEEYLYLKRNDSGAHDLLNAAKNKLMLLGMTEKQINKINTDNHVHAITTVYSPYSGFVLEESQNKEIVSASGSMGNNSGMKSTAIMNERNKEILLREGAYVDKGAMVFKVVNTNIVWAIFEVYSTQLVYIKVNQPIHIQSESAEEMIRGKINFIEPSYKEATGTSRIRIYLDNKNQNLKIGTIVSAEIEAGEKKGLWIPQSSVYDLGTDKIVFIKRNGVFETRKVSLGYSSGNEVEVINGITAEEEIAQNAQFMVDSESFIKLNNWKD